MDKHCANCIYRCYITAGLYCCDYIGCTGHARSLICPPGARCTEKKTVQRTPPNPNGRPKAVFDEATCMQLYQKGMSDIKIGKHFGLSKNPSPHGGLGITCHQTVGLRKPGWHFSMAADKGGTERWTIRRAPCWAIERRPSYEGVGGL